MSEGKSSESGAPTRASRRQNQEAVLRFGQTEFIGAAEHPERLDPAQFPDLDPEIARQHRTRQRERNFVADFVILCAADDLPRSARAIIHAADTEAIGIRVLHGFEDLRDHDLIDGRAARLEAFDFHAGHGEQVGEFGGIAGKIHVFAEPVEGDFHQNCRRKR